MSLTNIRFMVVYCFLVVLPVLGLVKVLKKGPAISAPHFVGGTWRLEANAVELAAMLCGKSASAIQESFVTISQSGKSLVLELNSDPPVTGPGVIEGSIIKASLVLFPPGLTTCVSGRLLTLSANVDPRVGGGSLTGALRIEACPTCMTLDFRATRQVRHLNKGAL